MALNTIPSHKDADSYITIDEANTYFSDFYYGDTVWVAASTALKEQALRMATKIIDRFRFFNEKLDNEQRLAFPRSNAETAGGTADSGDTTHLTSSLLADKDQYPDDYWNYGCVKILEGTNEYDKRQIKDFTRSTGQLEVFSAFTAAIDNTSQFQLIKEVPLAVKHAQAEIALWIIKGQHKGSRAALQAEGVKSFSVGGLSETFEGGKDIAIPQEAQNLLDRYISKIGYYGG
jgi:hypothetical protein